MINFRSVSIKGAFNFGRARVLWKDGLLKVFNADGLALRVRSKIPMRKEGHIRAWHAETASGNVTMRSKCMTCGGKKWWRVYRASDNELWGLT